MNLNMTIDPEMLADQIIFLRGALAGRNLTDHEQFLIIDMLRILGGIQRALHAQKLAVPMAAE